MRRNFQIVLDETDHRSIKSSAASYGLTIGGYLSRLQHLNDFAQSFADDDFNNQLNILFETLMTSQNRPNGGNYE